MKRKVKRKVTEKHDRNMLILSLRVLFVSMTQLLSQALCMKTGVDHHACETTLVHSKHTAVRFLCSFETQPNSSHACAFVCPDAHDRTVCQHAGRGLSASVDSQDTFWIFSRSINAQHERSFIDVRLHLLNLPSQIARFPFNVLSVG